MKPFLYRIAEMYYHNEGDNLSHTVFVFPNRRSGKFFCHYLSQIAGKPIFSPRIITINVLMNELAQMQPIDKLELLFTLYEEYNRLQPTDEPFDRFVFWGEMLVGDFDDVDKYMVDAQRLFTNIRDLKDLEQLYLSPEQVAIIRQFWDTYFTPSTDSEKKIEFNRLWSIMFSLYTSLRERLSSRGVGYEGMIFREVAERSLNGGLPQLSSMSITRDCTRIVFIGFNALTEAERTLLLYYKQNEQADFYWDYNAPTMCSDKENRAGYFIDRNISQFPSRYDISETITSAPEMTVMPVPSGIGQVKQAGNILDRLIKEGIVDKENALNTAVVLPDEELLIPMIYSIPSEVSNINITMGYSLTNTSVASLFECISNLQRRIRLSSGRALYYHIEIAAILNHRLVKECVGSDIIDDILNTMNVKNMAYVLSDFLREKHPLLNLIFTPITTDDSCHAGEYLMTILDYLMDETYDAERDTDDATEVELNVQALEHEYVYHYRNMVARLNDVIASHSDTVMSVNTYFLLLNKLSFSVPFDGEPLSGLQIMGVLETRALDFDNIIILSMNEGTFPKKSVAGSFIPYNLRRGFNLVTTEHQDSIYAYYFYRMISRAKRVYMLYDSRTEGLKRGEMSRFIYQLQHHYAHILPGYKVQTVSVEHTLQSKFVTPISISNTGRVSERLRRFLYDGEHREPSLSASSIKTYINCPLQFYMQYIEGIDTEDEISEAVDSSVFGQIYHDVMAHIYNRMKEKHGVRDENGNVTAVNVTHDMLDKVLSDMDGVMRLIEQRFNVVFYHADPSAHAPHLTGENLITAHTVKEYVQRTIEHDKQYAPFLYMASELNVKNVPVALGNGKCVRFKAFIDRVDYVVDKLRIIDYKTGSEKVEFSAVEELFNTESEKSWGALLQIFLYCKLYHTAFPHCNDKLLPLIYEVRKAFTQLVPDVTMNNATLQSYDDVKEEYERLLNDCLEEIFDEEKPFVQTQVVKHCTYCNFKAICKR